MKEMPDEDVFVSQSGLSERDSRAIWSRFARIPSNQEFLDRRKKADALYLTLMNVVWSFGFMQILGLCVIELCTRFYNPFGSELLKRLNSYLFLRKFEIIYALSPM